MKKLLIIVAMFLFIIPSIVMAEECDSSKISIGSLELVGSKVAGVDNVDIENGASIVDNKIVLNLKFSSVDDYAQYSFVIKNDSNEDYELTDKSITIDSDYIDYTLSTDDNLNIIKAGEEKTVLLNIKYSKEVDSSSFKDGSYTESKIMNLNYSYDKKSNPVADILENPKTGAFKYFLVLVALIVSVLLIIKERRSKVMLLLLVLGLIPISIKALCTCNIAVESNVVIEKKNPTFIYIVKDCDDIEYPYPPFEFEVGMTVGDWFDSEYFNNITNKHEIPNEEVAHFKGDIKSAMINTLNSEDNTSYDDDTINDYYLKENDSFVFGPFCGVS